MAVTSPRIVREGDTDLSSPEAMLASPPFAGLEGEELALALWRFVVDGFYHFFPAHETEYGRHSVYDPTLLVNAYGFAICGVTANLLGTLCMDAGFAARIAFIRGHEGTEVFYEGRWHFLDGDLKAYHRLHPPREDIIASLEDLVAETSDLLARERRALAPRFAHGHPILSERRAHGQSRAGARRIAKISWTLKQERRVAKPSWTLGQERGNAIA